jgi:leucyl-tRNA synthetase
MEYKFREIETKWQEQWKQSNAYRVSNESSKPKFYVLDMFPYPSGAGLHVGHPLGYIASDIYSRFKRLKGFNVLHPMGYDAFGLPAEQYAIEHGVHPAVSTDQNIANFRKQLDNIGFCYDWEREVRTCDPGYYKWTQWIFLQLFNSFYNRKANKAEKIEVLIAAFEREGNVGHPIPNSQFQITSFTAGEWKSFDEKTQQDILMQYRLAFCGYGEVNWCEALGTVLANDEVVNGVSERGGHPVVKKKLRQWYLRITEYADRLLEGLERIEFSESMKEMQTNWIGKSSGAEISFEIKASNQHKSSQLVVYTTRPDTIFGVDFMVIAPELELVDQIKSAEQAGAVDEYIAYVKSRSERERQAEKKNTGVFTGAYAVNPFDGREIPIWISEYVLAGYGTGAIMAVPCGDDRDFKFAKHFNIPITNIVGKHFNGEEANSTKDAVLENSGFLNGTPMREASEIVIGKLEEMGIGTRKLNYRMRDAAFSRQRYWGEPFPIAWKNGIAYPLNEDQLPLTLPEVENYKPGPEGEGPLANIPDWINQFESSIPASGGGALETNTMPGYAGSSWYFLRYMDPKNETAFCDRTVSDYWNQVDLYIGGTEHAVGHLLYSRMWTKALYDLGHIGFDEPFKKLVNQGMIQGISKKIYRLDYKAHLHKEGESSLYYYMYLMDSLGQIFVEKIDDPFNSGYDLFYSADEVNRIVSSEAWKTQYEESMQFSPIHVPVKYVDGDVIDIEKLWQNERNFSKAIFISTGKYFQDGFFRSYGNIISEASEKVLAISEVEKMSKRYQNVVNPDEIVAKYGADTFRMYEMFLGPVEISKPWDTKGIEGVHRFLKKLWRLFYDEVKGQVWNAEKATDAELKVLHKTIKKIEDDTERFSFNTGVSTFMIAVNELSELKCHKKEILESLLILLTPYAPHVSEELWSRLGNSGSILDAAFPKFEAKYVTESTKDYPVAINGKTRTELTLDLSITQAEVEAIILSNEVVLKWLDGKQPKKIIYVKNKMINVVI